MENSTMLILIIRIDSFEAYPSDVNYQLESFIEIENKFCRQLTPEIIEKINDVINEE